MTYIKSLSHPLSVSPPSADRKKNGNTFFSHTFPARRSISINKTFPTQITRVVCEYKTRYTHLSAAAQ